MGKFFAELNALDLADKDLGVLGNGYVRKLSDFECGLADYFCVKSAVDKNGLSDLLGLLGVQEVASSVGEFLLDCVIYVLMDDDRLLGGADHAVVKGLGVDNGVDRKNYIGGVVDNGGGVAGADAESGLAR